ncbi:MAG: hypothetical protein KIT60_06990 [Burkholderiaceae bacterium]|nr:hypothetical protein [Burkholderiaceae bacterium]
MRLPNKHPQEVKLVVLPFGGEIEPGVTILSYQVLAITVTQGTDATPDNVRDGDGLIDNLALKVYQRVKAGVNGCDYLFDTLATDSSGLKHAIQFTLPVRSLIAPT